MNFLDSSANAILPMNTNNAIISKDIIDDHVKKIKEHELSKFEGLCKDFKVYDEKDKKHLKPSFYESMIDKLERSKNTFISEHQDMPKNMLDEYIEIEQKKIKKYEYLGKQLQIYKQNVETQIATIPKNSIQLMEELKTLVDEIVKRIVNETNLRYTYIITKILSRKINVEEKDHTKIFGQFRKELFGNTVEETERTKIFDSIVAGVTEKIDPKIQVEIIPHIIETVKQQMCKFISFYLVLSTDNIIDILNDVTSYLKDFETAVNHGIYDWFCSNLNDSSITDITSAKLGKSVATKMMIVYNRSIKNNFNKLFSQYLVDALRCLNITTYFDKEDINAYIQKVKESGKTEDIEIAKTIVNKYMLDAKAEETHDAIKTEDVKQKMDKFIVKTEIKVEDAKINFEKINAEAEQVKANVEENKDEYKAEIAFAQADIEESIAKLRKMRAIISKEATKKEKALKQAIDKAVKEAVADFEADGINEYEQDEANKIKANLAESAKKQAIMFFEYDYKNGKKNEDTDVEQIELTNELKNKDSVMEQLKLMNKISDLKLKLAKAKSNLNRPKVLAKKVKIAKNEYEQNVKTLAKAKDKLEALNKAKAESSDDVKIENLAIEFKSDASTGVRRVIVEEVDDDDEASAKPTLEGFVNTIPLNMLIEANELLAKYNSYFKTNINAKALGRRISKYFNNERHTAKKIRYYIRK